jgi:hypothetical protein
MQNFLGVHFLRSYVDDPSDSFGIGNKHEAKQMSKVQKEIKMETDGQ